MKKKRKLAWAGWELRNTRTRTFLPISWVKEEKTYQYNTILDINHGFNEQNEICLRFFTHNYDFVYFNKDNTDAKWKRLLAEVSRVSSRKQYLTQLEACDFVDPTLRSGVLIRRIKNKQNDAKIFSLYHVVNIIR